MPTPRSESRLRGTLTNGVHLTVLWAFAFAQPLFDILGRNAQFFAIRGSTRGDIVVFTLAVTLVPPAVLLALEAAAALVNSQLGAALHLVFVAALVSLFVLLAVKEAGIASTTTALVLAAVIGAVGALAYLRFGLARAFLTVLAPAPLLFVGLFLLHSPVSKLTLVSTAKAHAARVSARAPVVVVVFDEFPIVSLMDAQGRIDAVRYPNFAALADDSTWFRNATTVASYSESAIPAILTGRYSRPDQLPIFSDHPQNLFSLLGGSYRMDVFESITSLCPSSLCKERNDQALTGRMRSLISDVSVVYLHLLLPRSLEARLPSIETSWMNFAGGDTSADQSAAARRRELRSGPKRWWENRQLQFEAFVRTIKPSARPWLYLIQIELPHSPWEYLPDGKYYRNTSHTIAHAQPWGRDPVLVEQAYQRHLLQVGFVDRLLGDLLRRLRRVGIYDRSLIVVTADHGVSFRPGDFRRTPLTRTNLPDIALVPLFIKRPFQRSGRIADIHVQTIDIVPTVADVLRIPLPWSVDGRSVFASHRGPVPVVVDDEDRTVTSAAASLPAQLDTALRRQIRLFGWGDRRQGLYGIGPRPDLLGRAVDSFPSRAAPTAVKVDDPNALRSVDPASSFVPSSITGRVTGPGARPGRNIAIAVNGRIEAVGRTFSLAGSIWFSVIVPEASLHPGANTVQVFFLSSQRAKTVLERLDLLRVAG